MTVGDSTPRLRYHELRKNSPVAYQYEDDALTGVSRGDNVPLGQIIDLLHRNPGRVDHERSGPVHVIVRWFGLEAMDISFSQRTGGSLTRT